MTHLWIPNETGWDLFPIEGLPATPPFDETVSVVAAGDDGWALLSPSTRLFVNGITVPTGLVLLRDRDEIRIGAGEASFFSTERLATTEPLPALDPPPGCPRCKQAVAPSTPAVRCPGCDLWHHQCEDLPCWRYAETCALCDYSTDPDTGYRFHPEAL